MQFQIISHGKEIMFARQLVSFTPFNTHDRYWLVWETRNPVHPGSAESTLGKVQPTARYKTVPGLCDWCVLASCLRQGIVGEAHGQHKIRELAGYWDAWTATLQWQTASGGLFWVKFRT